MVDGRGFLRAGRWALQDDLGPEDKVIGPGPRRDAGRIPRLWECSDGCVSVCSTWRGGHAQVSYSFWGGSAWREALARKCTRGSLSRPFPASHPFQRFLALFLEVAATPGEPRPPRLQHHRQDRGSPPGIRRLLLPLLWKPGNKGRRRRGVGGGGSASRPGRRGPESGTPGQLAGGMRQLGTRTLPWKPWEGPVPAASLTGEGCQAGLVVPGRCAPP